jgi:hypothetical protein
MSETMGYRVRIQQVERPSNRSFYINFPSPIADAVGMQKGRYSNGSSRIAIPLSFKRIKPAKSCLKNGKGKPPEL